MKELYFDIETYSETDIKAGGAYRYAMDPAFCILLISYSVDWSSEVHTIDFTKGESMPRELEKALLDPAIIKWARNAQFERVCMSTYFRRHGQLARGFLDPSSWRCTAVWSRELGLPGDLDGCGEVLKVDKQKMKVGKNLIYMFCRPYRGKRLMPFEKPIEWDTFVLYNRRDVEADLEIHKKLAKCPLPESEWDNYVIDQRINDRGVRVDTNFAEHAIEIGETIKSLLTLQSSQITGLSNTNSISQLKSWLSDKGVNTDVLDKEAVADILNSTNDPDVIQVLKNRQLLGKSSLTKYTAMLNCVVGDRAHGTIMFYGAPRTGRYAGRLIQVQNLPRNSIETLDTARQLVLEGDDDTLDMLYDSPTQVLSELIRTALIPSDGYVFTVADYSAIEARVIAWLSGEQWVLDAFANGKDIYCETASQMFGVPVVKHGENGELRSKGKIATLACGYGGGSGALLAFGADRMGMTDDEMKQTVSQWRTANSRTVQFWWDVDSAVRDAITDGVESRVGAKKNIRIYKVKGMLAIELPSGRSLMYPSPKIVEQTKPGWSGDCITYAGPTTVSKWARIESYGPKFVENIVQAVARDLLAVSLQRAEDRGLRPVMHVHDEIICEAKKGTEADALKALAECMEELPVWAEGLPLRADGYTTPYYKKD